MEKTSTPLKATSLAGLGDLSKATQLEFWRSNEERHERIALAKMTSVSEAEVQEWLGAIERAIYRGTGEE